MNETKELNDLLFEMEIFVQFLNNLPWKRHAIKGGLLKLNDKR